MEAGAGLNAPTQIALPSKAMELTALVEASRGRVALEARLRRRGAAPRLGRSSSPARWTALTSDRLGGQLA